NEQCENTLYLLHDALTSHPVQFPNLCTMFTKDLENLRAMLMDDRVIDWTQDTIVRGIPGSYCDLIKEVATSSGMDVKEFKHYSLMVHHNPESLLHNESDPTLKISSLQVSHAELVVKPFAYSGNDLTLSHVRSCIQHLPSACILDDSGNPVSWCLSDELCEMRRAFTLPEYRRAGYMKTVFTALIKQMHVMGFPVYAHVSEENTAAINMFTSFGFCADWVIVLHLTFSPCIWSITCMPYLSDLEIVTVQTSSTG
ncbi:GLYL3 protein, partial [Atractosteus spatula]|nr:GLYL3 protein [Atractosteus spatula]